MSSLHQCLRGGAAYRAARPEQQHTLALPFVIIARHEILRLHNVRDETILQAAAMQLRVDNVAQAPDKDGFRFAFQVLPAQP